MNEEELKELIVSLRSSLIDLRLEFATLSRELDITIDWMDKLDEELREEIDKGSD